MWHCGVSLLTALDHIGQHLGLGNIGPQALECTRNIVAVVQNNGQFVIMTDYVFLKIYFMYIPVLSQYNNSPSTRSGECRRKPRKFEHYRCRHIVAS